MNPDRFTELSPDYALGLLEGDDLARFEDHLAAGCEVCEAELARMDAVADALAYAGPLMLAPAGLKERVLAAVESDLAAGTAPAAPVATSVPAAAAGTSAAAPAAAVPAGAATAQPSLAPNREPIQPTYAPGPWPPPGRAPQPAPPRRKGFLERLWPALAILGLLAAGLAGVYAMRLKKENGLVRADLERVQAEKHELVRIADVVNAPGLRLIALAGQPAAPAGEGRVLWSPEARKAVLYARSLPAPAAGRDYQLWVLAGETAKSEGVFPVDAQGGAVYVLPEVPDPSGVGGFAVTLEPAGGLAQPGGPTVLFGAVPAGAGN